MGVKQTRFPESGIDDVKARASTAKANAKDLELAGKRANFDAAQAYRDAGRLFRLVDDPEYRDMYLKAAKMSELVDNFTGALVLYLEMRSNEDVRRVAPMAATESWAAEVSALGRALLQISSTEMGSEAEKVAIEECRKIVTKPRPLRTTE